MAQGDSHQFVAFDFISKAGVLFNLPFNTLKIGLVNNSIVPDMATLDPRWGPGGTTDFSVNQVALGAAYTGPILLTGVTWLQSGATTVLSFSNPVVGADIISGFSGAYWGILYNDTVAGKYAMGFVDLGGPVSNVISPININVSAAGFGINTAP